jgi:AP-3 complex subunit beta
MLSESSFEQQPLTHIQARDLTLEAAKDVGPRRPTKPLPAQQIKKLLDSRHEREVLDGLRRVIAVRTSQMPPWEELC